MWVIYIDIYKFVLFADGSIIYISGDGVNEILHTDNTDLSRVHKGALSIRLAVDIYKAN